MKKVLINRRTGDKEEVKVGFSWTTLLFGVLVPLYRGDWKWLIIMLILDSLSVGIAWFIFPFIYNKIYLKGLYDKGYEPVKTLTLT